MGVEALNGTVCTRVYEHYPGNFTFQFGAATLAVDTLWRVIANGRVALTSRDHGHQFGLPAPVDAYAEAVSLLRGRQVVDVRLAQGSADLVVEFDGGQRVEILTDSSGYEPWTLHAPGVHLVAHGGGRVADFSPEA